MLNLAESILTYKPISVIQNYVIPGMKSSLLIDNGGFGKVRLFKMTREHDYYVIPHSHRFNFECLVLSGEVNNVIYEICSDGDLHCQTTLKYNSIGNYVREEGAFQQYSQRTERYRSGDSYSMYSTDIHSIGFSKGASVLIFEGPTLSYESTILQPIVNGKIIPTFKVEDWMFERVK